MSRFLCSGGPLVRSISAGQADGRGQDEEGHLAEHVGGGADPPEEDAMSAPPHDQDGRAFDRRENLILIPGTDPSA